MSMQDSLEKQLNAMLADHRPCHYAVFNGTGQVVWVPKHTPCWFEGQSGKLIIDMANGSRCETQLLVPQEQAPFIQCSKTLWTASRFLRCLVAWILHAFHWTLHAALHHPEGNYEASVCMQGFLRCTVGLPI